MDADVLNISRTLDVPVSRLYMLSNNRIPRKKCRGKEYGNYHQVKISQGFGRKKRVLSVPNSSLKFVQRRILSTILCKLPVSGYATAYCKGKSLIDNASPHVGKEMVMKLDISKFFDNIDDDMVFFALSHLGFSTAATSLLTHLCTYHSRLPQGAPTSPYIANLVMKKFDEEIGKWCSSRNISYTRYCDDLTFSGSRYAIKESCVLSKVRSMLFFKGFELNQKKTVFASSARQQRVTGVVVNEKPALSRQQRRQIRQEVYFAAKYGVKSSLRRRKIRLSPEEYLRSLMGRISFALRLQPENREMQENFQRVKELMSQLPIN